ncbi:MAG: cytochrome b [Woeseiaceae bacterium]
MPRKIHKQDASARLYDSAEIYGWISILLHWTTTVIVIALWFIGKSILNGSSEDAEDVRQLHVSIAASAWLLILFRIVWRLRSGHPHINGQSMLIHRIAKFTHYGMLVFLTVMLVSGPLLVWSSCSAIGIFDVLLIPGPVAESEALRSFAWLLHSNASLLLFVLILLHIGGALKHLMFHTDDTIIRMIWPGRQDNPVAEE